MLDMRTIAVDSNSGIGTKAALLDNQRAFHGLSNLRGHQFVPEIHVVLDTQLSTVSGPRAPAGS